MPFAAGPWHTPPQFPDAAAELCLVLVFHTTIHHRYLAMHYKGGWVEQDGTPLEPGWWVSRWAYITSSIERMSELPTMHELPTENRLFVAFSQTDAERLCLLSRYITELKKELEVLRAPAPMHMNEAAAVRRLQGELRQAEHMRSTQLASRDARLEHQRRTLIELQEQVQKLHSTLKRTEHELKQALQAAEHSQERHAATRRHVQQLENKLHNLRTKAPARK